MSGPRRWWNTAAALDHNEQQELIVTYPTISVAALAAAIEAAKANMKSAEDADDPHEACRHLDLIEAFTSAAARTRAVTDADRDAHRRLAVEIGSDLVGLAAGPDPLNTLDRWRIIEDMQALCERLDEQDEPAAAA